MEFRVATWYVNYRGMSAAPVFSEMVRGRELDLLTLREGARAAWINWGAGGGNGVITDFDAGLDRERHRLSRCWPS